jgi:choline dehydrogenase-like flavoprotein
MSIIDALHEPTDQILTTDTCVVGAGAAGITLARELSKTNSDVILLESGSLSLEGDTQALYQGNNIGLEYFDLLTCRLRYFGGTTNHWGGYCRYNDEIDYLGRPEYGVPKWPLSADELTPYIQLAARQLELDYDNFNPHTIFTKHGQKSTDLLDDESLGLQTKVFQITKNRRLAEIHKDEIKQSTKIRLYLHLNAVDIKLNNSGNQVSELITKTIYGKNIKVKANNFILACHAIENARLLLSSDSQVSNGIGNEHDHVGRYFMDHVHLHASEFIPTQNFPILYNTRYLHKLGINANIGFTDSSLREMGILQYYCRFNPVYTSQSVETALRNINNTLWEPYDEQLLNDMSVVLSDLVGATKLTITTKSLKYSPHPRFYRLDHRIEQAPNPLSRIKLSTERDSLGNRRADLDWQLNEMDYRTFRLGQDKIIKELSALGAGRFRVTEITDEYVNDNAAGHYHHIGTTRMADNEKYGVVDKNCQVFNIHNLYIAGSSVFPTSGYSGPTMMVMAMALRLAKHLKKQSS